MAEDSSDKDIERIVAEINGSFKQTSAAITAVSRDPIIARPLAGVSTSLKYEENVANISRNFSLIDTKIRLVDKTMRSNAAMLTRNNRLIEKADNRIQRIVEDQNRHMFETLENHLEALNVNEHIDNRIEYWIRAGWLGNIGSRSSKTSLANARSRVVATADNGRIATVLAALGIGGAVGFTAAKGIGLVGRVLAKTSFLGSIALIAGFPQAMKNPNSNIYTEIGDVADALKGFIDPDYKGHEARDLVRGLVKKISDYDKQAAIDRRKEAEKQRKLSETLLRLKDMKFRQKDDDLPIGEVRSKDEIVRLGNRPGIEDKNDPHYGMTPMQIEAYDMIVAENDRRLRVELDKWGQLGYSTAKIEEIKRENQKRIDIFMGYVRGTNTLSGPSRRGVRKVKPDWREHESPNYFEPQEQFKELKAPDVKKTSSLDGRVHVASLEEDFITRPEDSYYDRLSQAVRSSRNVAKAFTQEVDAYSLNTRKASLTSIEDFDIKANGDVFLKSRKKLTLEAPQIVLIGNINYASIQGAVMPSFANFEQANPGRAAISGVLGNLSGTANSVANSTMAGTGLGSGYSVPGGGSGGGSAGVSNVPVSNRAAYAFQFFKSKGWTDAQAAGLVGNLMAESGSNLDPTAVGDSGQAYGIAQWHKDRRNNFTRQFGIDIKNSTFEQQLEFVHWELTNTEKKAGNKLRETNDAGSAAAVVDQYYERSSGAHRQRRIDNANAVMGNIDAASTPSAQPQTGSGSSLGTKVSLASYGKGGQPKAVGKNSVTTGAFSTNSGARDVSSASSPLEVAKKYAGLDERNPEDARVLQNLFKTEAGIDLDPETAAWCAAFMNGVLGEAGAGGTGSAAARSFLNYGTAVEQPQIGDVVVFDRGGGWKGHVGLITGIEERGGKTYLKVLGGNQSEEGSGKRGVAVNIKEFSTDKVLGYRRPPKGAGAKMQQAAEKKPDSKLKPDRDTGSRLEEFAKKERDKKLVTSKAPVVVNNVVKPTDTAKKTNTHDNVNMSAGAGLQTNSIVI